MTRYSEGGPSISRSGNASIWHVPLCHQTVPKRGCAAASEGHAAPPPQTYFSDYLVEQNLSWKPADCGPDQYHQSVRFCREVRCRWTGRSHNLPQPIASQDDAAKVPERDDPLLDASNGDVPAPTQPVREVLDEPSDILKEAWDVLRSNSEIASVALFQCSFGASITPLRPSSTWLRPVPVCDVSRSSRGACAPECV